MANVTSHYEAPLHIPGGPTIPPGATVKVDRWEVHSKRPIVRAWLRAKAISVESEAGKPLDEMTKAELIDEARLRGVAVHDGMLKAEILDLLKD